MFSLDKMTQQNIQDISSKNKHLKKLVVKWLAKILGDILCFLQCKWKKKKQ